MLFILLVINELYKLLLNEGGDRITELQGLEVASRDHLA